MSILGNNVEETKLVDGLNEGSAVYSLTMDNVKIYMINHRPYLNKTTVSGLIRGGGKKRLSSAEYNKAINSFKGVTVKLKAGTVTVRKLYFYDKNMSDISINETLNNKIKIIIETYNDTHRDTEVEKYDDSSIDDRILDVTAGEIIDNFMVAKSISLNTAGEHSISKISQIQSFGEFISAFIKHEALIDITSMVKTSYTTVSVETDDDYRLIFTPINYKLDENGLFRCVGFDVVIEIPSNHIDKHATELDGVKEFYDNMFAYLGGLRETEMFIKNESLEMYFMEA